ncbi:hypothetical protein GRW89_04960 [Pseudomonas moraviensis]|jgi:hypothetical protein|uniref:hypothetical protein n=2 Tax=Pseudomonas TaxID=286 RepID=UPI00135EB3FE|nr:MULTISPECIES: hypothetical protein [Pseudomonas]MDH1259543.1 hypothetical protein [Pseudomonas atacamensis]MXI45851.1 hypothetical protein [Pseudomonas moraviensis]
MSAASRIHAGDIGSFCGKSSLDFANNSFARRRLFFFLQLSLEDGIFISVKLNAYLHYFAVGKLVARADVHFVADLGRLRLPECTILQLSKISLS